MNKYPKTLEIRVCETFIVNKLEEKVLFETPIFSYKSWIKETVIEFASLARAPTFLNNLAP